MDRLAAEVKVEHPARVEAALEEEFHRERQRKRRSSWLFASGTIAATLMAALLAQHERTVRPQAPSAPVTEETQDPQQPFVALPYLTPPAPYERIQVVRMEVPVAALIAAGLPMPGANPGARVDADVAVGQDGRARAVRLVSTSRFN
jgi:hypothetical protein